MEGCWGEENTRNDQTLPTARKDIPYHSQRLLKLLKVNGSTLVEIKVIKRILTVNCGKHIYLPFPYLIQQRLKLLKINLPAMWVLAAITVGGNLGGPIGMLLGVPIAVYLYRKINKPIEA